MLSPVGGLLASGLLSLGSVGTIKSWRVIFLVEGIITSGIGILAIFLIPGDPETARFLTEEERALALARIRSASLAGSHEKEKPTLRTIMRGIFNVNTMVCSLGFTFVNISVQGLSLFMPTVIATLGHYSMLDFHLSEPQFNFERPLTTFLTSYC